VIERAPDGTISLRQSTGEPLLGLLALPWRPTTDVDMAARNGAAAAIKTHRA
jgi:hypothetical protein